MRNIVKNLNIINTKACGRQSKKRTGRPYYNAIGAFDIETTSIDDIEQSVMYIWQYALMDLEKEEITCVYGRTWKEWIEFSEILNAGNGKILTYVHNLAYEFQFLRGIHKFESDEVFLIKSRKPLKLEYSSGIEMRCSYMLTNSSLAKFTKDYNVEHQKLSGVEFNYGKKRYWFTKMTDREIEYAVNDVIGLAEAIYKLMVANNDNPYSIPLTSTGYVRRDVRGAMFTWTRQHRAMFVPLKIQKMLQDAFRGGDTHANRYYVGMTIDDVVSSDRSSSYPDVLCNCDYPVTPFKFSMRDIRSEIKRGKAVIAMIKINNVVLKNEYDPAPYLSISKCREYTDVVEDNGRVLAADTLTMTVTDVDFKLIDDQYTFTDLQTVDMYTADYGKLPQVLIDKIHDYYKGKTSLKGIVGKEVDYMMSKQKINSCYGMMVQNPLKPEMEFYEGLEEPFRVKEMTEEEQLDNYYNKQAFVPYQWGVWCAAWARQRLREVIKIAGDNFVYCDTDSVKYIKDDTISQKIEEYNTQLQSLSENSNSYADDRKGVRHYMGVYEADGNYQKFRTMGAKKYAYIDDTGLHVTISGVNKKIAPDELKTIDNMQVGFIFNRAGGTESKYNDSDYGRYAILDVTTNLYIKDSTYTLGYGKDYFKLLTNMDYYYQTRQKLLDNV